MNKPTIVELFADDGQHSHWQLADTDTGEVLWSEDPVEDAARKSPDIDGWGSMLNQHMDDPRKGGLKWKWVRSHFVQITDDKVGDVSEFREGAVVVSVNWFSTVAWAAADRIRQLEDANKRMLEMWDYASKKINWGASFFDARAIELMNTAPIEARKMLDE